MKELRRMPSNVIAFLLAVSIFLTAGHTAVADKPVSPPEFEWAISAAGPEHDKTRGLAVDPDGNVLLTGEFTSTAAFGDHKRTAVGSMDFFVAKVSPAGEFLWVTTGGGEMIDRGYAVACDHLGNAYVTGHFQSPTATFSDVTVKNSGDYDLFVAKYTPAGQLVWIRTGGGAGYDYGHGIAADRLGNVFVAAAIAGEGNYDGQTVGHAGPAHLVCLGLDANGRARWHHAAAGEGSSSGHAMAADQQGNCYLGGYASGVSTLAGESLGTEGSRDLVAAKLDSNGNLVWLHSGHGSDSAMIHEITADSQGNVWASGMFQGELKLPDRTVSNAGRHDILLTRFDASGKRLWTRTAGGEGIDYGLGITTDGQGNCYTTGSFTGEVAFEGTLQKSQTAGSDIHIVNLDDDGHLQWFQQCGGVRTDHAYSIVSDGRGSLYLSGACSGPATFGKHSLDNLGSNDIFLAKISIE
ncbi:MAG: SBBP repeat-containing protein [Planctomycetota bacterium]|jgi:hypothetical protein